MPHTGKSTHLVSEVLLSTEKGIFFSFTLFSNIINRLLFSLKKKSVEESHYKQHKVKFLKYQVSDLSPSTAANSFSKPISLHPNITVLVVPDGTE